jgi:hypothetical protein
MEYLKNNICKFTPLFPIDYNKKINMFSSCFFKMVNRGYKDFSTYVNGLKDLNDKIIKRKLDYKIRLFIDESIHSDKEIFGMIKKLECVQPVLYSCPNFIIEEKYHIGLFGTMVRFFPFFNFPNNDANIVISSDIDSTNLTGIINDINMIKKYSFFNDIYLLKSGDLNRSLRYRYNFLHNNILNPYVFALSFVSCRRINSNVFTDFIIKVKNDKNSLAYSYHYKVNKYENEDDISKYKSHGSFIYGVDEYFLNDILCPYLIDNKLCYVVRTSWDIFGTLYFVLQMKKAIEDKEINLIKYIYDYVYGELGIKNDKKMDIVEKFNILDTIIYDKNPKSFKKKYEIFRVFYKMFLYLKKNSNYKFIFPDGFYYLFVDDSQNPDKLNKYFGTYKINFFRVLGCDDDRDIIISEEKFNKEDIDKLKDFYSKYK